MINLSVYQFQNKLKFLLFLLSDNKEFVVTVIICVHLKLNKLKFLLFLLPVMKQFVVTDIICVHLKLNKLKFPSFSTSIHETVCSDCYNFCTSQTRRLQLFFRTSDCCVMHLVLYACSWLLFCDQQGGNFFYTRQQ